MRLNNGNKIITEDDIILNDGSISLSEKFANQQSQIDQLKSNVKWMYKYGGVGSGGSSGTSSTNFSIYASLNNIQINDNNIVLSSTGNYQLYITINNPNGYSYNVQYSYTTTSSTGSTITQTYTQILSVDNNWSFTTTINLNNNDTLTVTASNGNETQSVSCSYITSPYTFTASLINNSGTTLGSEIFVSTAASNGINILLDYVISVDCDIQYTYTFNGESQTGVIEDTNGSITFPINPELFVEENSGYYSATIDLQITPSGQNLVTQQLTVSFSLIPESLYALIQPQTGVFYTQEVQDPESNAYYYSPGYIVFNYRIYEGTNNNRVYTVNIYLNDTLLSTSSVTERDLNTIQIFANTSGVNTLKIVVSRTTTYTATYYFYVEDSSVSLDWFDNPSEWTSYYYRISEVTSPFTNYLNQTCIEQTQTGNILTFSGIEAPNLTGDSTMNTHVAIGLQFSSINADNPTIINIYNSSYGSSPVMTISQESTERLGVSKDFFIRKQESYNVDSVDQYHLIQIYSQYVKQIDTDFYYEVSLYIDGVLEQCFPQIYNSPLNITSVDVQNVNCSINLFEIDFKQSSLNNNCDYEVYKFYLKYLSFIKSQDVSEQLQLTEYLPEYQIGLDGRITVDLTTISNVASLVSTPTLIMTYQDSGTFSDFMGSLETNYGEDGTGTGSDMNFPITLSWSPGSGNGVSNITFPTGYDTAQFRASLQGSSTKMYRVKNFTVSLENTDDSNEADLYLFSPNFSNDNTSTFLPETEFILKADVVDSSHSNNTTCGKFINTVCGKFSGNAFSDNGYYSNYIRNCLEGFPTLLYLEVVTTDSTTQTTSSIYYYLGIYNFNLGRTSYYNLGYKDTSVFGTTSGLLTDAGSGFTFYKISQSENILKNNLVVAEIQGNSNYFDFSQYDSSILFQQTLTGSFTDNTYMFGDIVYGSNMTLQTAQNAIQTFVQRVALGGGYLFDYLKKNRGSYEDGYKAEFTDEDGNTTGESKNQVPDYTQQYIRSLGNSSSWEYALKETISEGTLTDLNTLIVPDEDLGTLAYLNFQSLAEYYTICMVLGLVDSVQKNLNIKTWNNRTWYLAFYDMDTCLGINNAGSDINYFAFSDYWNGNSTTSNNIDYPENVTIYRDFAPHSLGEAGFDTPSSYLFAVAKYAKLAYQDSNNVGYAYTSTYPQELYAKWRSGTINSSTNQGVLCNADSFVDNYYANNLSEVIPALISYNYRSKYFSLGSSNSSVTWTNTDYNKFSGTRINKVRDWFQGRLHILDAYFNLNNSIINTFTYLDSSNTWQTLYVGGSPVTDLTYTTNYNLSNNEDITILHNIFSESGLQLSGSINLVIQCPEYSPLQIYNANGSVMYNYILGGENDQSISFTASGSQAFFFGGSSSWTYLENINWISNVSSLSITSDKLQTITGSSGTFSAIELNTPNVNTISLTSSNYSGTLNLNGSDSYPNLTSVNISSSKLSLVMNGLNVTALYAQNITNTSGSISIYNCNSLNTFNISGSKLNSLTITGITGSLKNLSLTNQNITNMNIQCSEEGGSLTITDTTVESITIQGFETVTISNCTSLKKIVINHSTSAPTLKNLTIQNCTDSSLSITSTDTSIDTVCDISTLEESLDSFSLYGCIGITEIKLPTGTTLSQSAFYNLSKLQYLEGNNLYIKYPYTFRGCTNYTLRTSSNEYTDLIVDSSCTNLSYTFYNNKVITLEDAKHFIEECVPEDNNVTNIQDMFYNNTNIEYTYDQFVSDLKDSTNYRIDMSRLNKVTNAYECFYLCPIYAYHKQMWNLGASSGVNLGKYQLPGVNYTVYLTKDFLENVISKITIWTQYATSSSPDFVFVDDNGNQLDGPVTLYEVFNPTINEITYHPSKLREFNGFSSSTQTIDLTGVFTSDWTSLTTISSLFVSKTNYIGIDNLFYNLPKINEIHGCLSVSTSDDCERVNLYTFINWDNYLSDCTAIFKKFNDVDNSSMFSFKKYIYWEDYLSLCNKILQKTNLTDINYLFRNCQIIVESIPEEFTFGQSSVTNSTISSIRALFQDCTLNLEIDGTENIPMPLSSTFFRNFTAIADVRNTFNGCYFNKPIPFNFFNKRQIDNTVTRSVYVLVNEQYQPATLTSYTYRQEIESFYGVFQDAQFTSDCTQYDPSIYEESGLLSRNTVIYDGEEYTTYYTRTTNISYDEEGNPQYTYIYNEQTLTQNTEITDAENLTGYFNAPTNFAEFQLNSSNSKDRLIIPPDFFYGAASQISGSYSNDAVQSYDYAFACKTELQGIIPEHIFKNAPAGSCKYTFYNMNVIPVLRATGTDGINITNVYTCYPDDYTTHTDLTYAFASKPVLPQDQNYADYSIYNYVLIISDNTIPTTVQMMDYAFYYTSNIAYTSANDNSSITYKINQIGSWSENQDGSLTVTLGFDLTKFTSLRCDYLFTGKLTQLLYGNMFRDTSYYSNFMYESDDTYVLIGYYNAYGLSPNIIFPKLISGSQSYGRSPDRMITTNNTTATTFLLKSSQIMDPVNDITDYSNIFTFYE